MKFRKMNWNTDAQYLYNLELKSYETEPAPTSWWKTFEGDVFVVTDQDTPVASVAVEKKTFQPTGQGQSSSLHIERICVHPKYRDRKIGRALVSKAYVFAQKRGLPYLTITIPEFSVTEVRGFLSKMGFKATITLPVKIEMYGKHYDQYLFVCEVKPR